MPVQILRTHGVVMKDGTLSASNRNHGNNIMFGVSHIDRFSMEVSEIEHHGHKGHAGGVLIGVFPVDGNLDVEYMEGTGGVFLFAKDCEENSEYFDIEVYGDATQDERVLLGGMWPRGSLRSLRINYQEGHLSVSVNGETHFKVPGRIPEGNFRPCVSLHKEARVNVSVSLPSMKRKVDIESLQPQKIARNLWSSKDFADAHIVCGKTSIPVHRCVLAAASPFFDRAFKSSMKEGANARISIEDAEPAVLELLLSFLYTGRFESGFDKHATSVLPLAHRLEIPDVVEHCGCILAERLTAENIASHISILRPFCDDPTIRPYWDNIAHKIQYDSTLVKVMMKHTR